MKKLFLALLFFPAFVWAQTQVPNLPGPVLIPWQIGTQIGFTTQQPSIHHGNLVSAQIGAGAASFGPTSTWCVATNGVHTLWCSAWTVADASAWGVPCNSDPNGPAKALLIGGIIGITPAIPGVDSNLDLMFRTLGDTTALGPPSFAYVGQSATVNDGSRTNMSAIVALTDCKFEWAYQISTPSSFFTQPAVPSYLINIGPMMWIR